jgi:hypothetical protein
MQDVARTINVRTHHDPGDAEASIVRCGLCVPSSGMVGDRLWAKSDRNSDDCSLPPLRVPVNVARNVGRAISNVEPRTYLS